MKGSFLHLDFFLVFCLPLIEGTLIALLDLVLAPSSQVILSPGE